MPAPLTSAPVRPPRDTRLDIARGWMQVSIFIAHVAGSAFAWTIHAAWGFSDSSEQFVFLSGFTLGSVFALKSTRDGYATAKSDMQARTGRLYATHLFVFALFAALVFAADATLLPGETARLHWTFFAEQPWFAVPAAMVMLYQPDFMGILPIFVWCMLLLPGFLLLAGRIGGWALLPPAALYLAVQAGLVAMPALFENGIAFDPLAWQMIFLAGAWLGRRSLLTGGAAVPHHPFLIGGATLIVILGFWARLVQHGVLGGPDLPMQALMHKEALALPRLLHALALAFLVAALLPREARWMRAAPARALATIGRHSLQVFCLGLFLAWGASVALREWPAHAVWVDPLAIAAGVALLWALARWRDRGLRRTTATVAMG